MLSIDSSEVGALSTPGNTLFLQDLIQETLVEILQR